MNYVREQTVGEIIRGTFKIYFSHFGAFFVSVLLMIPFLIFTNILYAQESYVLIGFVYIVAVVVVGFFYAAITVIVSEICLGYKPSVARAYKRVFGMLIGKIFATNILATLITAIGYVLLVVPGIIAMIWFVFSQVVVTLEGTWGISALKRSRTLGKGNYARIFGLLVLLFCVAFVFLGIPVVVINLILAFLFPSAMTLAIVVTVILQCLFIPIGLIPFVLMYYDLRVRKEAYDITSLAEDLRH